MTYTSIHRRGDPGYNPDAARLAGKYVGRWKAVVKDNADPDKAGRLKLFIPALFGPDDTETTWTDWASPGEGYAPSGADDGSMVVPEIGALVWVTFEQGIADFPVWHGSFSAENKSGPKLAKGENDELGGIARAVKGVSVPASQAGASVYPYNRMLKLKNGTIVELDETSDNQRIRVRHPSGTFFEMTDPGDFVKQVLGDLLIWAGSNMKFGVVGDFVVATGGHLKLGASTASNRVLINNTISDFNGHGHEYFPGPSGLTKTSGPVSGSAPGATGPVIWTDADNTSESVRTD